MTNWQIQELVDLVSRRYEGWDNFNHPDFVADEIAYKQATIAKAQEMLNQSELDRLIAAGEYDTIIERLDRLARDNNLLWRRVPSVGDAAVLYHQDLDRPVFCTQLRNLLYSDRPSPERLQSFADYAAVHDLPVRWPFPTYFLFICHPDREMFVKPQAATWFLKFMGETDAAVSGSPDATTYATILAHADELLDSLRPYGARDMVDMQSFIWVCFRESRERAGRLDARGQIELDVPQSETVPPPMHDLAMDTVVVRESDPEWQEEVVTAGAGSVGYSVDEAEVYTLDRWQEETGLSDDELNNWVRAVERKGQAIFYGPPGTGKTYIAQRLAQYLTGRDGFWELVQFHPAYAYEDFMQGIRPLTGDDGTVRYELVPGRFLQFCEGARSHGGVCVLVIDEINRANLASVFGELMYLLEYREQAIPLSGGGTFSIPSNVRLIGTMNTADRSIALVDHALRRRFAFIPLRPNEDVLRHYLTRHGTDPQLVSDLISVLQRLNNQIGDPHYHLGHTFFLEPHLADQLEDIWRMEIEPYLEEYFFDQPDRLDEFRWEQTLPASRASTRRRTSPPLSD